MKTIMLYRKEFKTTPIPYREAHSLSKNGYKVKIITWNRIAVGPEMEEVNGIEVHNIKVRCSYGNPFHLALKILFYYWKVLFILKKQKFEVLHCHDLHTIPIGFLAGKLTRKPIIYDVHDFYFDKKIKFIKKLIQKIDGFFASKVDYIIVPSPYFLDYYKKLNGNVALIFNAPEKNIFTEKKELQSRVFTISYFGNVRWDKQLVDLMEAVKDIKNARIFIGGSGIKMEEIKRVAKNYDNVKIGGFVPYKELMDRYKESDCIYVVYHPTNQVIKYSVPMKIFEAMACGLPVISNCEGFTGEFVRKNRIGLCVEEGNLKQIREAVIKLMNDPELRKEFGENGRHLVEKFYNWENMEKILVKIYSEVLNKERKR